LMFAVAVLRSLGGGALPPAETGTAPVAQTATMGGLFTVFLLLRAFASGCTALTGVEAISNGVPAFRRPKNRNAVITLTLMGAVAITMFGGITVLAVALHARANPDGNPSVISQLAASVFGAGSALFYLSRRPPRESSSWLRTPHSTASRCWRPSWASTVTCPGSCTTGAIGWCSPTASCCWPPSPPH
jgi:amino acid transporter